MHLAAIITLHLAFQGHLPPSSGIGCLRAECSHSWPNPPGGASASQPCQSIDSPSDPTHPVSSLTLPLVLSSGERPSPAPGSGDAPAPGRLVLLCRGDGAEAETKLCSSVSCQHLPGGEAPPWEHLPRWEAGKGQREEGGARWGTHMGEELQGRRGARAVTLAGQWGVPALLT